MSKKRGKSISKTTSSQFYLILVIVLILFAYITSPFNRITIPKEIPNEKILEVPLSKQFYVLLNKIFILKEKPIIANISISSNLGEIYPAGKEVSISGNIRTIEDNAIIQHQKINVYLDDKKINSLYTISNGNYVLNFNPPKDGGRHKLEFRSNNFNILQGSTNFFETIATTTTTTTLLPETPTQDEQIQEELKSEESKPEEIKQEHPNEEIDEITIPEPSLEESKITPETSIEDSIKYLEVSIEEIKTTLNKFTDNQSILNLAQTSEVNINSTQYREILESLDVRNNITKTLGKLSSKLSSIKSFNSSSIPLDQKLSQINLELIDAISIKDTSFSDIKIVLFDELIESEESEVELQEFVLDKIIEEEELSGSQKEVFEETSKLLQTIATITKTGTVIDITYASGFQESITIFEKTIDLPNAYNSFFVNEYIDKNIKNDNSLSASKDISNLAGFGAFSILLDDPVIRWQFKNSKSVNLKYSVNGKVSKDNLDKAMSIMSADPIEGTASIGETEGIVTFLKDNQTKEETADDLLITLKNLKGQSDCQGLKNLLAEAEQKLQGDELFKVKAIVQLEYSLCEQPTGTSSEVPQTEKTDDNKLITYSLITITVLILLFGLMYLKSKR
tara:strand:- start:18818 stop:20686 length:1869 start_codon:yes stop_codon:yes gene_type:complete